LSRNTRGDKEYTRLQEIVNENKKLKREIGALRKQLARLDLDRHAYIKDIVDEHYAKEEQEGSTKDMLRQMKEKWRCRECKEGHMVIYLFNKINETWYLRQCNACSHKTKLQKYDSSVQGIMKNEDEKSKK
jgi:rubredoxin